MTSTCTDVIGDHGTRWRDEQRSYVIKKKEKKKKKKKKKKKNEA